MVFWHYTKPRKNPLPWSSSLHLTSDRSIGKTICGLKTRYLPCTGEWKTYTGLTQRAEQIWRKSTAGSTCKYRLMSSEQSQASNSLFSSKSLAAPSSCCVFLTYYFCLLKNASYSFNIKPAANSVCSKTKWEMTCLPRHINTYMDLYSTGWLLFNCSAAGDPLFCRMGYPMSPRAGNVHHSDSSFEKVILWTTFRTF